VTGEGKDDVESERSEAEGEGGETTENFVVTLERGVGIDAWAEGDEGCGVWHSGRETKGYGTTSLAGGASMCRMALSCCESERLLARPEKEESTGEAAANVTVGTRRGLVQE